MADKKKIVVQGVEVEVSQPFAEGHTLTEAEAKALNQVRAENIGNNVRKAIKEMLDGGEVTDEVTKAAGKLVAEKDAEYVFTLGNVGGSRKTMTPTEKEARIIARDLVNDAIRETGSTIKEWKEANPDKYEEKVAEYAENETVLAEAAKIVKQRSKLATAISL